MEPTERVTAQLDDIARQAVALKEELVASGPAVLPALAHYVAARETATIPLSAICEASNRTVAEVLAATFPQLRARFGPAEVVVVVNDNDDELTLFYADPTECAVRLLAYRYAQGSVVWAPPVTDIVAGPLNDFARAVMSAFAEVGAYN